MSCHVSVLKSRVAGNKLAWVTDKIKIMKTQKNLYSNWILTMYDGVKKEYNILKKTFRDQILDAKSSHIFNTLSASDNPSKTFFK